MEIRATTAGGAWTTNVVYGGTTFPLNEWHHIAGTYDAVSGNAIVYLDSKEDGRGKLSGNITPKTDVAWIGRGAAPFFNNYFTIKRIPDIICSENKSTNKTNSGSESVVAEKSGNYSGWKILRELRHFME